MYVAIFVDHTPVVVVVLTGSRIGVRGRDEKGRIDLRLRASIALGGMTIVLAVIACDDFELPSGRCQ